MKTAVKESTKLKRALALIKKGWCRKAGARDKHRNPVDIASPKAVAWCAFGACLATGASMTALSQRMGYSIPLYNDSPLVTRDDIIARFCEAIVVEKAKEKANAARK